MSSGFIDTATQLVARWKHRRRAVLRQIVAEAAPQLRREFKRLSVAISQARLDRVGDCEQRFVEVDGNASLERFRRENMTIHKQKLVEFLRGQRLCTRAQIRAGTTIPASSLSQLLKDDKTFRQVGRGLWGLVGKEYAAAE